MLSLHEWRSLFPFVSCAYIARPIQKVVHAILCRIAFEWLKECGVSIWINWTTMFYVDVQAEKTVNDAHVGDPCEANASGQVHIQNYILKTWVDRQRRK